MKNEWLYYNGYKISFGDGKNFLKLDDGHGYKTFGIYWKPLNYTT